MRFLANCSLFLLFGGVTSGSAQSSAQPSSALTNQFVQASGSQSVYKLATLPGNSLGTYDHLHLVAVLNSGWGGYANSVVDAIFSTRQGFVYLYTVRGARTTSAARLAAYQNADNSVDLYMIFAPGYTTGSYTVLESIQENIYPNPSNLGSATPSGTLLFDTSDPRYPAAETLDFNGDFEIDGNASVDGRLYVGPSDGGLFGDTQNTVLQSPQGGSVYFARLGVDGTRVSSVDGTLRIGGPNQGNASLVFADGSIQKSAASATIGPNGSTVIMNSQGTAGFQFAPDKQGIGGAFGAGGNLSLQANPVSDTANTGGFINLGGSARGDSLINKVVIAGNTNPSAPLTTSGILVNGANNVGLGLNPASDPSSRLEVNGSVTISRNSGGALIFPDGTRQVTAATASPSGVSQSGNTISLGGANQLSTINLGDPSYQGRTNVSGYLRLSGSDTSLFSDQGGYIGWNALTGGEGETDFINNQGTGGGGFAFFKAVSGSQGFSKQLLMRVTGSGQLAIGGAPASSGSLLDVQGNMTISGSGASMTFPDRTVQATAWNGTTQGGDYAESVEVVGETQAYECGDVIAIDPIEAGSFSRTAMAYSKLVAGVYSTKPGLTGRRLPVTKSKDGEIPLAIVGIVPVKVTADNGPIAIGDLLVASGKLGLAMKGTDPTRMLGAVLGKALSSLEHGDGTIEVLLQLQ